MDDFKVGNFIFKLCIITFKVTFGTSCVTKLVETTRQVHVLFYLFTVHSFVLSAL